MDLSSRQGDKRVLDILRQFGAEACQMPEGVAVRKGTLRGIELDASQIPDLVPVLSVAAAAAEGETRIVNAGRLRLKESDRLQTTAAMLRALGAEAEERPEGLRIQGKPRLAGGSADAAGDHRIAMSAAVAASVSLEAVTVLSAECTAKSYPRFWEDLEDLEVTD
jgi:3-phosphoshikimate 1-carboxyvinyltransferase